MNRVPLLLRAALRRIPDAWFAVTLLPETPCKSLDHNFSRGIVSWNAAGKDIIRCPVAGAGMRC